MYNIEIESDLYQILELKYWNESWDFVAINSNDREISATILQGNVKSVRLQVPYIDVVAQLFKLKIEESKAIPFRYVHSIPVKQLEIPKTLTVNYRRSEVMTGTIDKIVYTNLRNPGMRNSRKRYDLAPNTCGIATIHLSNNNGLKVLRRDWVDDGKGRFSPIWILIDKAWDAEYLVESIAGMMS